MVRSAPLLSVVAASLVAGSQGFAPAAKQSAVSATQLNFGIPKSFLPKDDEENKIEALPKKEMSLSGIVQLITAGAGAPFLGDYEGVDEETGKFMFSLEANNLVDENGNSKQTQAAYFENGRQQLVRAFLLVVSTVLWSCEAIFIGKSQRLLLLMRLGISNRLGGSRRRKEGEGGIQVSLAKVSTRLARAQKVNNIQINGSGNTTKIDCKYSVFSRRTILFRGLFLAWRLVTGETLICER